MKKIAFTFIMVSSFAVMQAQDITDALRYSTDELSGSARVRAMSGAFGALGGDISSLEINPAASAITLTTELGLTMGNYSVQNDNNFFGTNTSDSRDRFDLPQGGGVFVLNNMNDNADWKKLSLGINYSITNNYNNRNFIAGINPNNSIDKYFLHYAQGVELSNLETLPGESIDELYQYLGETNGLGFGAQQAFLGYQAYIIDPVTTDSNNTQYVSNALYSNGVDQEYTLSTKGANRKFSFNFAAQYKDILYLGINLNSHTFDLKKRTYLSEIGFNGYSSTQPYSLVQETAFENYLESYGTGFSLQLGAILKATESLRLGASYQSPTWYQIDDELSQGAFAVSIDDTGVEYDPDIVYPNITNIYETYKLKTPGKITGSIAYVFGKIAILSFDYTRKDYSGAKFKPENDYYFRSQNSDISNSLTASNMYRIGGEYRIDRLSLRGGYRFEGSPYKNGKTVGDLTGYSMGIGYNFGGTTLDISYDRAEQSSLYKLYNVGLTDSASVDRTFQNIMLTLNFKL